MRMLITAGPTREPIDAVRYISNRSSGKIGLHLARAALAANHEVTLLMGPAPAIDDQLQTLAATQPPHRFHLHRFESSAQLKQLLDAHLRDCDALVMAAAVADYRPVTVAEGKLPSDKTAGMTLHLQPTPDLVALAAAWKRPHQRIIAFALEEQAQLEERALAKMKRKGVDAIVANPLGTMEADAITPLWLTAAGERQAPGRLSKEAFAPWLVARIEAMFTGE